MMPDTAAGSDLWDEAPRLYQQERYEEAEAAYRALLRRQPGNVDLYLDLALVLTARGRPDEAANQYRKALSIDPGHVEARCKLAGLLLQQGCVPEAIEQYQRVIAIEPNCALAHYNLGAILQHRHLAGAVYHTRRALTIDPDFFEAHYNLACILFRCGAVNEAIEHYRRALNLRPDFERAHANLLMSLQYSAAVTPQELVAEHRRYAARFAAPLKGTLEPHANAREPERRLRLGYVSADLFDHPVGRFFEPVLVHRDAHGFETFCYSNTPGDDDALTRRLRAAADHWRSIVSLTDDEAATVIQQDGIDILVDLSGHTRGGRLLVLARKPAPVQATWLGYTHTTGLDAIDYFIGDRFVCRDEAVFVEEAVRQPHDFLCFTPPAVPIAVGPLPARARGAIGFGCFNNLAKIGPEVIALWARILHHLPDARLLLKDASFRDESVRQRYLELFGVQGITANRLVLHGLSPYAEYLAAYHDVDIALDPFPFNGGTTTIEALWMGVPVISLEANRPVGRMGAAHLTTAGFADLVASSPDEYVAKATALASDLRGLAALRTRLRQQLTESPLCDGPRFTRHLEHVYRAMWWRWCLHQQRSNHDSPATQF